uniref:indoleamine 2,3-dioxygenase 1 isoform X2 n=1 Tax=Monopterus albus TaxID=43700 RepID=UPI0009B2FC0B|nr:indoleamine 2,3-dioxygenase 2-like isoform X2 [Monopterus albus]
MPQEELPPYYQPWMDITWQLPELVHSHKLRAHINKMPLLSSSFLKKHKELRLARLALGMMTMGYVWQEGEDNPAEILPRNLSVPYWEVSQRLGLPPILTHNDVVLANWKKKDPEGPFDLENLELLFNFPGGDGGQGFFIVNLLVELAAAPALRSIPTVINGVRCGDTEAVARALEDIGQSIQDMTDTFKLIQMHADPLFFYGVLRIYLSGWRDNPCMPKGLIYEGVQTEPMQYSGGSAAQSSLLHCFDELLGVKHDEKSGAFLTRMRGYMLPAHRQLIQDISLQPSLRSFVQQHPSEQLNQAFHLCVTKLLALRNYHITAVSRFVTVPAAHARRLRNQRQGLEGELINRAPIALEEKGTSGSNIMIFLKTVRDQTKDAFLPETSMNLI